MVLLVLVASVTAHAQTNEERATELKQRGDELMRTFHFREALDVYNEAFKVGHDSAILYNRGRALEALGEYPLALDAFEEFFRVAPPELRARIPKPDELLSGIRSRIATVVITCDVAGASVLIRQKVEGTTPLTAPLRLSIGAAVIEVHAGGFKPFRREVALTNTAITIDAVLEPEHIGEGREPRSLLVTPLEPPRPNGFKWAAYTAGGIGVAGLALGTVFGALAVARKGDMDTHCPLKACDPTGAQARNDTWALAGVSTTGFIVGGIGIAAAVLFALVAPRQTKTRIGLDGAWVVW